MYLVLSLKMPNMLKVYNHFCNDNGYAAPCFTLIMEEDYRFLKNIDGSPSCFGSSG